MWILKFIFWIDNVMRYFYVVLICYLLFSGFCRVCSAESSKEEIVRSNVDTQCIESGGIIGIGVVKSSSLSYRYSVDSKSKAPLVRLVFGDGLNMDMPIVPIQMPTIIKVPHKWLGNIVYKEDGKHMIVYFSSSSEKSAVKAEDLVFEIGVPKINKDIKMFRYEDGSLVVAVDYLNLPYLAYFKDGSCVWGKAHKMDFDGPQMVNP